MQKLKESLFIIAGIVVLLGIVLVVGSAGAYGNGNIEFSRFAMQSILSVCMMIAGGLTMYACEDAVIE